jgi:hypothetical protein
MRRLDSAVLIVLTTCAAAAAKVDLTTLPARDTVQLTIYNSADMTLVRESRALTLKQGENALQFSWANTLIDPTSLEMLPRAIAELVYPPRVRNLGLWNVQSTLSGNMPVEITYLTSGLTWRAFYTGTLSADEKTMRLQGYVRVTNNSGEDYENAQTRLIVGKVHLLDQIAELARREYPYGRPGVVAMPSAGAAPVPSAPAVRGQVRRLAEVAAAKPKEIVKEGLSEYFLYTIEGTETIPTGWSKRLQSFDIDGVPVVNLYKYEQERYGPGVVRFLSFKNDQAHKLGQTPIPDGHLKVYRAVDEHKHLAYAGQSSFKYIPVNEDVELNLGTVLDIVVEPTLMDYRTENHRFDTKGNVSGWDDVQVFKVEVRNTRDVPARTEIARHFATQYWDLKRTGEIDNFEQVDLDTVKFTLNLPPYSKKTFEYTLTIYQGVRAEDRAKRSARPQ